MRVFRSPCFVWCCVLAVAAGVVAARPDRAASADPSDDKRPNILLIVADDLGWRDVGWHGGGWHGANKIRTPHMDRLVREGVELDQHYVQPVCTPTRVALLSGRYPGRFGPHDLTPSNLRALPPGTLTLASALKSRGYATYLSGKWHLGVLSEWGPNHYGFDHSYGSLAGAVDPWTHQYRAGPYAKTWHRDGKLFDEEGNATELVARQAVAWIREQKREPTRPWFVYVPFQAVHIPIDAPDEFKRVYDGEKFYDDAKKDDSARRFAAFVTQLDAKIGELVRALDETGQRENTLIVFTSDNGGLLSGGNAYVSEVPPTPVLSDNTPLRGQKGQLYEGGIRVPAFVNWPGKLAPRKVTAVMHAVDWMPTLSGLVGFEAEENPQWDGRDMWPVLTGEKQADEPRTIYWAYSKGSALRHGDWKLIDRRNGKRELFNLGDDPSEKRDVSASEPARVAELSKRLDAEQKLDRKDIPADARLPKAGS
ncbi:MAG: sulfatase-like hydrolase/transferase [Pirellulales bacterium]